MAKRWTPFAVGRRVFLPTRPDRAHDPAVRTVQTVRSLVGLAAILVVMVGYKLASSVQDAASQRFGDAWNNVLMLCVTFPVVVAVFVLSRGPGQRSVYARRALKPLGALLSVFFGMSTFALAMAPGAENLRTFLGPLKPVVEVVGFAFLILWMLPFVLYGIFMSLLHVFRTADIHDTLPPLLTTVAVWETSALSLITGDYPGVPAALRAVLLLGGPLSVTLISAWELHRLRHPRPLDPNRAPKYRYP